MNLWTKMGYPKIVEPKESWWSSPRHRKDFFTGVMLAITILPLFVLGILAYSWLWQQTPHDHGAVLFWTVAVTWALTLIVGWALVAG